MSNAYHHVYTACRELLAQEEHVNPNDISEIIYMLLLLVKNPDGRKKPYEYYVGNPYKK